MFRHKCLPLFRGLGCSRGGGSMTLGPGLPMRLLSWLAECQSLAWAAIFGIFIGKIALLGKFWRKKNLCRDIARIFDFNVQIPRKLLCFDTQPPRRQNWIYCFICLMISCLLTLQVSSRYEREKSICLIYVCYKREKKNCQFDTVNNVFDMKLSINMNHYQYDRICDRICDRTCMTEYI